MKIGEKVELAGLGPEDCRNNTEMQIKAQMKLQYWNGQN